MNLSAQTNYADDWNPDADGDNSVGVSDLLALLSVFAENDGDDDGIWDSQDDCVGAYDECGGCNGPGPQILGIDTIIVYYDSLYAEVINEWWVFEVGADTLLTYLCENPGCMDLSADNYDPYAIEADNSCVWAEGSPVCDFQNSYTFDGYTYDLVAIGEQCWFAENLRNEHYANGDVIPGDLSNGEWSNTSEGAQAIFANDGSNLADYGRLYNWYAVVDPRQLCPAGWHLPSDSDFTTLINFLGGSEIAGQVMKSSSYNVPAWDGNNVSGFSGLGAGERTWDGDFELEGFRAHFWSTSGLFRVLQSGNNSAQTWNAYFYERYGFSVRCLKDT